MGLVGALALLAIAGAGPAGADGPPVEVAATLTPATVRVGQQALLVVSVRGPVPPDGVLYAPPPAGARVIALGDVRRGEPAAAPLTEVFEQRYALFADQAGALEVPAASYTDAASAPLRAQSAPLALSVTAQPDDLGDGPWLPARALTVSEAGPPAVRMGPGQGLERMITIRAEGLPAEVLPTLVLTLPPGVRAIPEAPRLWNARGPDGVVGYRLERVLISAGAPGTYLLTTAPVRWWNTGTETFETAALPDWALTIAPFASANRRETPTWLPGGLRLPPEITATTNAANAPPWWRRPWVWALAGLTLALSMALWWRRRRAAGD